MGLLNERVMAGARDINEEVQSRRDIIVAEGVQAFEERYADRYPEIGTMLESSDAAVVQNAAQTMVMVERTEMFIENMKHQYGEAVVTQSLGQLPTRVLDVVRIFYPNQIANKVLDIQPIDGQVGQIFVMKPTFGDTFGGVSAGDEIFKDQPDNFNYASESIDGVLGTGDGTTTNFTGTINGTLVPIRPRTVSVIVGSVSLVDDGNGNIVGNGGSGTVNYATGAFDVTFAAAPANAADIVVEYCYSSEQAEETIRTVEFNLNLIPVKAKRHPLRFKHSVDAGLAANAHLAIDVGDTLSQLMGQYIKVERDNKVVQLINRNATPNATLNFDADTTGLSYDKRSFYGEIELKLDQAESLIQAQNGKGSVDFVICGANAANVFRNCRGFRETPQVAPIGAHEIGTLRDGTVTVIKSLTMQTNDYVFGFKGYQMGEAATILAEWIPVYFTPVFQAPTLSNSQGTMSMYDLFVNNKDYYYKGTLTNYGA